MFPFTVEYQRGVWSARKVRAPVQAQLNINRASKQTEGEGVSSIHNRTSLQLLKHKDATGANSNRK